MRKENSENSSVLDDEEKVGYFLRRDGKARSYKKIEINESEKKQVDQINNQIRNDNRLLEHLREMDHEFGIDPEEEYKEESQSREYTEWEEYCLHVAKQYIHHISSRFRRRLAIACFINGEKPSHYAKRVGCKRQTINRRLTEIRKEIIVCISSPDTKMRYFKKQARKHKNE